MTTRPSEMTCRNFRVGDDGEKDGVVQRRGGTNLPSAPWQPAKGAAVKDIETLDVVRPHREVRFLRRAGKLAAPRQDDQEGRQAPSSSVARSLHDRPPPSPATKSGFPIRAETSGGDRDLLRTEHHHRGGHAEHKLRDDEPRPVDPFLEYGIDDPHKPIRGPGPYQRQDQAAPGNWARHGRQSGRHQGKQDPKADGKYGVEALAARNHSRWKVPNSAPSKLPGPGRSIPASTLTGYQKPRPLAAAHRTAGRAIAAPPSQAARHSGERDWKPFGPKDHGRHRDAEDELREQEPRPN